MGRTTLAVILPALLLCAPAIAPAEETQEPAARLAAAVGTVEYLGPEIDRFEPAPVNLALQPGDRVRTGPESRTEIEFEGGGIVRLGAESEAEVLAVGRSPVVRLLMGRAYGKGPRLPGESLTLEAGLRIVGAAEASVFRVETAPGEPRGEVTVVAGSVAVETEGERVDLARGLRLPAGQRAAIAATALVRDDFDRWNAERDAVLARSAVGRYAPAHLTGLGDLEGAGSWVRTDDYGHAWRPHVAAGWRPFARGRWVFRPYYGWVWLAPEPWGYTTYHYGRWVPSGLYGWIWIPGPRFVISIGAPYAPPPPVRVHRPPVVVVPRHVVVVPPHHVTRPHRVARPPVIVHRPPVVSRPRVIVHRPPVVRPPWPARPPAVVPESAAPGPRRQPLPVSLERRTPSPRPAVVVEPRNQGRSPGAVAAPRRDPRSGTDARQGAFRRQPMPR